MNSVLIGLLAETFVHPGRGQNEGAIDLPVAREVATDYPFIAGSSFKGSLRDKAEHAWGADSERVKDVFGKQDDAGGVLVSDARLLLLPVRSLDGAYKWATCPHLLERLQRDLSRSNVADASWAVPHDVHKKEALGKSNGQSKLFLEERSFTVKDEVDDRIVDVLTALIVHDEAKQRLSEQLIVLNDNDFAWFARYGLAVQARNVLEDETKTSQNLWYEETLPPDTLMYALVSERNDSNALRQVKTLFDERPYLQTGGNETVGQGWFAVEWLNGGAS
ncbi:MAG: type III-B CRISPR module RAMP protein Cmr4 [Salinibacter sp.]